MVPVIEKHVDARLGTFNGIARVVVNEDADEEKRVRSACVGFAGPSRTYETPHLAPTLLHMSLFFLDTPSRAKWFPK